MEDQEETAANKPTPEQPAICEECKTNPSKYKCPGCSVRSCSLPCVKAHKQRTQCSGKRQQTEFVPISQFDDNLLLSDYNMLEDVKRVAESAQRMRFKTFGYSHFRLPFPLKTLRNAAGSRRTKVLFHSTGMSKRVTNRSYYNYKKKFISWTIEWRFHSTDVVLIDHGVHENTTLRSVIETHLNPGPWNHPLRQFCEESVESLKFFIRTNSKGPRSPFRELDINAPIRQQLANLIILEYPVIQVYLPSHSYNFEVIKESIPPRKPALIEESLNDNFPSPKGVTFREEEIEDRGSTGTQVLDLMKHVKPNPVIQTPYQNGSEKDVNAIAKVVQDARPVLNKYESIVKVEEEEKNSGSTVTRVLDLMKHVKPNPLIQTPYQNGNEKELNDVGKVVQDARPVLNSYESIAKVEEEEKNSDSNTMDLGFIGDMDFDFEQGLIDAYSELIAQTNPDDFLNLEGVLNEEFELEERKHYQDLSEVLQTEDELEEGEIR